MMNNQDKIFYPLVAILAVLGLSQYNGWFDITVYTAPIFDAFFDMPWAFLIPILLLTWLVYASFNYFKKHMYLDGGLATKHTEAKSEDYTWLNALETWGPF